MKLISSKKTKRNVALFFVLAFMLSNLLSLFGPSAQAAVSVTAPSTGTCFQHNGTVANGALVTVYNIGTIQLSLTASEISPGVDAAGTTAATTAAVSNAVTAGHIDTASDIIGNIFTITPPTGTNFVIVPGFQDTTASRTNILLNANAQISNALSTDSTNAAVDSTLDIDVGVVTAGTVGLGRAVVAIARDADAGSATSNFGSETYPKSGTGSNTVTITVNGLGIAIPPSGDTALSGTLTATLDSTVPSGTGASGGSGTPAVASAISGLSQTINLCTVTSPAGKIEAVLDIDNDSSELYDKSGTTSQNLVALGQIGSNTTIAIFDTNTVAAGVSSSTLVDTEAIIIKGIGTGTTGVTATDQAIATGALTSDIDTDAEFPSATGLDITSSLFANNSGAAGSAPITINFEDDNSLAVTTLQAVDIVITNTTAAGGTGLPTIAGFSGAQTSRFGFLGALRAALHEGGNATSLANTVSGTAWGVASIIGGPTGSIANQESTNPTTGAPGLATSTANGTGATTLEPFQPSFVDLRLFCSASTNPVAGWFAILNSGVAANTIGTTAGGTKQLIKRSQAGQKFAGPNATLFFQTLTNISGTQASSSLTADATRQFIVGEKIVAVGLDTVNGSNALLYASCANNALTIYPIQNGFDAARDVIAITPKLQVTNVSSTFSQDVNVIANVSGNNLSGTTSLTLATLVGVPATGGNSSLASAQGVAVSENSSLGIDCSSGGQSSVVLSGVATGSVTTAATAACTGGVIAPPSTFFTGGAPNSVSGTTVIDGAPVVQGEARGILVTESSVTGFNQLLNQVGGGATGTVFEVQLPTGCDVIDDRDDNNTAVSNSASTGGNDVTRFSVTQTGGITASVAAGGSGDAALTNVNVVASASGTTPARAYFRISAGNGSAADAAVTDSILFRIDSQDLFCPTTVTGDLSGKILAQNKVSGPTLTSNLGTAMFGTATQALSFAFADDVATSVKGEVSTNTNLGPTPRFTGTGGGVTNSHPFKIVELDNRSFPIGGRVSKRNLDPDNTTTGTVITKGQIWIIPASGAAFSAAPATADVSFSDNSLVVDGAPVLVASATQDANAPLGTILIGIKKNTASGATDPATTKTTVTVKNLKLAAATSSTTDLVASVEFYSQDAGVVVNTPGVAAGNSSSTPTLFTPFAPGSTKASTQLNVATTSAVQLGAGSLANSLITSRLTTEGAPQLNPFAKVIATQANADSSKITVSAVAPTATSSSGSSALATENIVTVTGVAGAVDGGAEVVITSGPNASTVYGSTTVIASTDGSFTAMLRGDCSPPNTSLTLIVTEQLSGNKSTSVTKTALCNGATGETADSVFAAIAGSDGQATVAKVLSYVSAQGGLSAIVTAGGAKLQGVIKAAKAALGLS
ncbi:MAG: hypothetical protein HY094_07995 [Candidatus Melainabacteria bacterium]|nr:hypothetical protein [Candidatus Melainabacteria bacterium]